MGSIIPGFIAKDVRIRRSVLPGFIAKRIRLTLIITSNFIGEGIRVTGTIIPSYFTKCVCIRIMTVYTNNEHNYTMFHYKGQGVRMMHYSMPSFIANCVGEMCANFTSFISKCVRMIRTVETGRII